MLTHVFEYEVNVFVVIGPMDVEQSDNVWMIAKMLQEHDFTKSSLGVGLIPESVYTHKKGHADRELSIKIESNIMGWSISHINPSSPLPETMSTTTTKLSRYNPIAPSVTVTRTKKGPQFFPRNTFLNIISFSYLYF
jgi:hypothetical protein